MPNEQFIELSDTTFRSIWKELKQDRGRLLITSADGPFNQAKFSLYHNSDFSGPDYLSAHLDIKRNREYNLRIPMKCINPGKSPTICEFDPTQTNVGNYLFSVNRLFVIGTGLPEGGVLFIPRGAQAKPAFSHAISKAVNEIIKYDKNSGLENQIDKLVNWVMDDLRQLKDPVSVYFNRKTA